MNRPRPEELDTNPLSTTAANLLRRAGSPRRALLVHHRDGGQIVPLRPGASVVLGRGAPSDIVVADPNLSRQHARISLVGADVVVSDLGSTNGTYVAGQRIERAMLGPGAEITMGAVTVTVHDAAAEEEAAQVAGHDRFRPMLEDELARARYFGRPLCVVMLSCGEAHVSSWASHVHDALRPVDRLGFHSDRAVEVLLPEAPVAHALELVAAVAKASASPAQAAALRAGIASFPLSATSVEDLLGACWAALRAATREDPVRTAPAQSTRTWEDPAASVAPPARPVSACAAMSYLLDAATRVADAAVPVLLQGETGTGKEVLARFIHESGRRRPRPLVCVNCAAIPAQLLESTLFGHEKGAFTGAVGLQRGVFEAADGGTIFLDEIGELTATAQAALLRVLESKQFARVGSTREITVDVRILAATHRDLEAMCAAGRFREDLLYRLNAITLVVPPLRDRQEDIPALAQRMLEQANLANGRGVLGFEPEAMESLEAYAWPGNVRELKNAIEWAVVMSREATIGVDDLPERVRAAAVRPLTRPAPAESAPAMIDLGALSGDFRSRMERVEAELIEQALVDAQWNKAETARRLAMPLRTLVHKIKAHGIRRP